MCDLWERVKRSVEDGKAGGGSNVYGWVKKQKGFLRRTIFVIAWSCLRLLASYLLIKKSLLPAWPCEHVRSFVPFTSNLSYHS